MSAIDRLFSNPAFWEGALRTRVELFRQDQCPITERGLVVAAEIAAGLRWRHGRHVLQVPAFQKWRRLADHFGDFQAPSEAV